MKPRIEESGYVTSSRASGTRTGSIRPKKHIEGKKRKIYLNYLSRGVEGEVRKWKYENGTGTGNIRRHKGQEYSDVGAPAKTKYSSIPGGGEYFFTHF
jgi:hypothetical protein